MSGKVAKAASTSKADKDSGLKDQLESEAKAPDPELTPEGTNTTDPTFADGAMEVDSPPWNPPTE